MDVASDQPAFLLLDALGVGLADGALAKTASFGIRGMMERVRALGGWLDINGAPGKGTTVMLSIPRRRPRTGAAPSPKTL